jgi:acetyltransferase-like isoleucine patch superfamily enzyme
MNKYLRASICEMISICKFGLLKIEKGKKFNCKLINLVSPLTEVTVDKGGSLYIGNKFRMRSGAKIRVRKNASISIGKNFSMSNNCVITAWEKIEIGDDVQFGPNVLVYDQDHDLKVSGGLAAEQYKTKPIYIGNGVWIGANTIILRGTVIGDNTVIGAGSVVKGDIPANSLVVQKRETNIMKL